MSALPNNPGELANDYGPNVTTAQGFANALNTNAANNVVNSELYYIPSSLLNGYNAAFQNYWQYQSLGNVNDAEEFDDPDLLLL